MMDGPDPTAGGPGPSRPVPERGRLILSASLTAWCLVVLVLFAVQSADVTGGAAGVLRTLAVALALVYAWWLTGFRILRAATRGARKEDDPLATSVLELGLGVSAVIALLFAAGTTGLFRPWFAWTLLAVLLVGPHVAFVREMRLRASRLLAGARPSLLGAALLLAACMTLAQSLTPVTSQDALVYHLSIPARYVEEGGIVHVQGNFFAQFPQNIEMLFTMGLLLGDGSLAQWHHWMLGVAAAGAVAALARALHPRASGLLAAAVFATMPTVLLIAGWAYVDLGVVFFTTLSLLSFLRWQARDERFDLFLAALFAGVAAGSKYTAGLQGILVAAGVFAVGAARHRPGREVLKLALGAAAVAFLTASPWYVKNVIQTGNPLYPFAHAIFGGRDWDAERAQVLSLALAEWGGEHGLLETLLLPWRLTMSGRFFSEEGFDGVIGCTFLIAAPFALASLKLSPGHRVAGAFAAAYAIFWVLTTRQVRFLLPALASASAIIGAGVPVLVTGRWARPALFACLGAAIAVNLSMAAVHFASHNPLPVLMGLESKGQYLAREVPGGDYAVFEYIERELPRDSHILLGSLGNPGFLIKRRYTSDAFFENRTLAAILAASGGESEAHEALRARGFTHILFRWDCVFDPSNRKSEIRLADQMKLMGLLNRHGRLLTQAGGTFLYEIRGDPTGEQGAKTGEQRTEN
ncbi:MAG TPA: glycosyltransferase family 39 protein [Planctomycetota bacterium]|nr:glycosyltransferase family 39 protein [Planctomycetota bacterium]